MYRYTHAHAVPRIEQKLWQLKCGLDEVGDLEDDSGVTHAVLCLSHSWAVSEQRESLCCWCASLLLSLPYCRLSFFVPLDVFSGLVSLSLL